MLLTKTQCVIVGECSDGLQAAQEAQELQPDLILMDLAIPKLSGMVALRRIMKVSPNSKVVILSQNNDAEIVQEVLRLGAQGYLLKSDANQLPLGVDACM
jgi:DNA-binding NarL/FixJ family response regulator